MRKVKAKEGEKQWLLQDGNGLWISELLICSD